MIGWDGVVLPPGLARLLGRDGGSMFGNALLGQGNFWPMLTTGLLRDETLAGLAAIVLLTAGAMTLRNSNELVGYRHREGDVAGGGRPAAAQAAAFAWRRPVLTGCGLALCFWLAVLSVSRPSQFLYFNF